MLAQFEKGIAFTAVEFLQVEDVLVKLDRLSDVIHLDSDVIATVYLYAHGHTLACTAKIACVLETSSRRVSYLQLTSHHGGDHQAGFLLHSAFMGEESVPEQFETLLPLAVEWATEEEERILREGVSLAEHEVLDAVAVGVRNPKRIRLLQVDEIPAPLHPALKAAAESIRCLTPPPRGLAFRHGLFIRSDCWRDRSLIVHELAHTAQYERLGGILPFLRKYLFECLTIGYAQAPLELEAISMADRVLSAPCRKIKEYAIHV